MASKRPAPENDDAEAAADAAAVTAYLAALPERARPVVAELRRHLLAVVPGAQEAIRYGVPTLRVDGRNVVHYGGYAGHVAVYPVPEANGELAERISQFRAGKGTLRFPLNAPVPFDLVEQVGAALYARSRRR